MPLQASLIGKLNNTPLYKSSYLMPIFEAVMNSFQAIDDAPSSPDHSITIHVRRDNTLQPSPNDNPCGFSITDTGIGFDKDN